MTVGVKWSTMTLRDYIQFVTRLDMSRQPVKDISWAQIVKTDKVIKPSHERGEIPYNWEVCDITNAKPASKKKKKNKKLHVEIPQFDSKESEKDKKDEKNEKDEGEDEFKFFEIRNSLREINEGGCQSNEAIEYRYKERQKKLLINYKINNESTSTYTSSSDMVDSVKRVCKNKRGLRKSNNQNKINESENLEMERYKKNALMIGLLRSKNDDYNDIDFITREPEGFLDSSELVNDESEITSQSEKKFMAQYKIYRLMESLDDIEIIYHPLMGEIQKDADWQKYMLKRKAKEFTESPRDFYMGINNDSFSFESNSSE